MLIYHLRHACMRQFNILERQYLVGLILSYQATRPDLVKIQPVKRAFLIHG